MSDIGRASQLAPSAAQLPVNVYFDVPLLALEHQKLFTPAPRYVGHELMVPNIGDYHALAHEGNGRALTRSAQGVELISNVCRHRQAIMLQGRGNTEQIVCPLHRWTYDLKGQLIGAPHFPQQPCTHLKRYDLQNWNGLLFEHGPSGRNIAQELKQIAVAADLNFEGYAFAHAHVHECNYNWKTFIEVYLEDYHVGPFHPGLGKFVNCEDLSWEFGPHYSVQTVGIHQDLKHPGTPIYKEWHDQVLRFNGGKVPKYGAIWMTLYPNIMVEWYPNVLVVSTLHPNGPQSTTNVVEFYYPEEIALFEPEYIAAEQKAYMETCVEDDEIALRMDAGRKALMQRGDNEVGPYQSPMEDGMLHFHEWYRERMGFEVSGSIHASQSTNAAVASHTPVHNLHRVA